MANDEVTLRQVMESMLSRFEQQDSALQKFDNRLEKSEEVILALQTGDLQEIKMSIHTIKTKVEHANNNESMETLKGQMDTITEKLDKMAVWQSEVEKIATINERVRNLEDRQRETEGARQVLSPLGKLLLGVVSAFLIAVILAYFGLK